MRPPRVAILALFFSASLFLVCRSISSFRRTGATVTTTTTRPKSSFRAFFSFTTPFSLFPPNALISLTDDNSTFFPARPAAFGRPLVSNGLSGQLWIGSGFPDDTLQDGEGEGELGCSDIPGWEDGRARLAAMAAAQGLGSSKHGSPPLDSTIPSSEEVEKDSAVGQDAGETKQSNDKPNPVDDGTDDYLHEALQQTKGGRHSGRTTASGSSHADIQSIQESAEITGKIVLLSRGGCGFVEKVKWAQRRGALALIVGDNQRGGPLIQMFARGNVDNVTIPSVFTSRTTAHLLASLMDPGGTLEHTVDENGNPIMKVQHAAKSGNDEKGNTPQTKPSAPEKRASRAKKAGVGVPRRSWFVRRFVQGTRSRSEDAPVDHTQDLPARHSSKGGSSPSVGTTNPEDGSASPEGSGPVGGGSLAFRSRELRPSTAPGRNRLTKLLFGKSTTGDADNDGSDQTYAPKSASVHSQPGHYTAREGLWVTITPTGGASPFFDTLLVLVISPLITLTVVYALLILRVKIRMRRWRAPKSVVDRLPVRTYHTVAPSPIQTSRAPSPSSSSPTTPLLQGLSRSTTQAQTAMGAPEGDDAPQAGDALPTASAPSQENNQPGGSSQWKKYMGRQVECVVCLEEYVDGVSRVMSLPCGHEFHVECITPWLTTRRRTCPICKNDVVRSLARGSSSPQYEPFREDEDDSNDEISDLDQFIPHSPDRIDDLERGPGWSQGSRRDWHSTRNDIWFNTASNRLGGSSSFTSRRESSGNNRGR